ncbi:hypothetical protein ES332_A03G000100v1 [Gossypium tomentosum]|uniref:Uncharacterized protein n=1 Tax=Gossypium tomentosum TaxID=34277 RepID=A0A5D2R092_GOSTO|nr:hypothetical protein ES332_A03G000100v1 [Gossypium tomentosum]
MMHAQEADPANLEVLLALGVNHTNGTSFEAKLCACLGKHGYQLRQPVQNKARHAGWKTEEPNLVNFLKQLHLTNPLILTFSGSPRNPQIVSFLELLDLPYVLDNASDSRDTPSSLPQKGSPRNPQIVSFLELLDLPYVLDNASDSRDTPSSLPQKDDYSEDIPNEDEDDLEDDAERNNENRSS